MVLANENNPLMRGHAPGGRSGPNHCQECSERWPCDWAVLCDMYADAEATGRAAVRALAKNWKHAYHPEDGATCSSEQCRDAAAVLATDTAKAWLASEGRDDDKPM